MTSVFIFDIDGTLTAPRQPMSRSMADFMERFAGSAAVFLVTGSDWPKVCEQVPERVRRLCQGIFCCAGAEHWRDEQRIAHRPFEFPEDLIVRFTGLVNVSPYPYRLGRHVERRTGLLNVSVVGRNADRKARAAYRKYDDQTGERGWIVEQLRLHFPDFDYSIGGDISIDIAPRGWSKAQVLPTVLAEVPDAAIRFFGDRMEVGGNDLPLADALGALAGDHVAFAVAGPDDTQSRLAALTEEGRRMAAPIAFEAMPA